jgi:type II secretory pathway component PulM
VTARAPRLIAGAAVLLILIVLGVIVVPPYAANWRLQNYVNDLAADSSTTQRPAETVRELVVKKAAALGIPVSDDDVHVSRSEGMLKIDVLYMVQVNLAGYGVDLHFRPGAGG